MLTLELTKNAEKLHEIADLYESAFPWCERRATNEFFSCIFYEKNFSCYKILQNADFVGFITVWDFKNFVYVEHFAIKNEFRGQNFGSLALFLLGKMVASPTVLEVEPPIDSQSRRRVAFYNKNGFVLCQRPYLQPSYHGENAVPLCLMTNNEKWLNENFERVKSLIYKYVYHYEETSD